MRIFGAILLVVGLLLSITIIFWFIGIPLMIVGGILMAVGGKPHAITNIVQVSGHPGTANSVGSYPHSDGNYRLPPEVRAFRF